MTKFIFVTGGVVSSVGKGISVASIGRILKSRDVSVSVLKLDPYLNVDPGTMSPYQHGEVFVTNDGGETDLDLGHYERFIDVNLTKSSNITAGQIYSDVIARERKGEFLGGTIQTIPHVTDAIKKKILSLAEESKAQTIVVEVGGTVGDIEGLPFLEAIRQMRNEVGRDNVYYIHVTFLPYLSSSGELKTKPTQHSVRELRSIGIQPDVIICRSDYPLSSDIKNKITVHCDVQSRAVITLPTVSSVYQVPIILEDEGLGDLIIESLNLPAQRGGMIDWRTMFEAIARPKDSIRIAVVGKYVDLHDSYISVKESLLHAGLAQERDVQLEWVPSEDIEIDDSFAVLDSVHGIVIPGGFGPRGVEGMIRTARYARENRIPYLGLCLGLQVMVIEVARNLLGKRDAHSTEVNPNTPDPVIDLMPDQRDIKEMGGSMRLGVYPCDVVKGSWAAKAYQSTRIYERHRHRFEFNNDYRKQLNEVGLRPTGLSPDGRLVEIMELSGQPFMVGVQFHPEFLSRPDQPHPLFREFIGVAKDTLIKGSQHTLSINETSSSGIFYNLS